MKKKRKALLKIFALILSFALFSSFNLSFVRAQELGGSTELSEETTEQESSEEISTQEDSSDETTGEEGTPEDENGDQNAPEEGNDGDEETPEESNGDENSSEETPEEGNGDENSGEETPEEVDGDENSSKETPEEGASDENGGEQTPEQEGNDEKNGDEEKTDEKDSEKEASEQEDDEEKDIPIEVSIEAGEMQFDYIEGNNGEKGKWQISGNTIKFNNYSSDYTYNISMELNMNSSYYSELFIVSEENFDLSPGEEKTVTIIFNGDSIENFSKERAGDAGNVNISISAVH